MVRHFSGAFAFSFGFFEVRSIARAVAPAIAAATPPIVQTEAHDVVGCPAGIRKDRPQRRGGERSLRVTEVDVEIFELDAPAAAGAEVPVRKQVADDRSAPSR